MPKSGPPAEAVVNPLAAPRAADDRTDRHFELTDIFELADRPAGPRLADELTTLIVSAANGSRIATWVQGQGARPVRQLKIALTARAEAESPTG